MTAFEYSPYPLQLLSQVCHPTETTDPRRNPSQCFHYIDIASVSNSSFQILAHKEIVGAVAPSRARKRIRAGDVIFATTRPYLRSIALVSETYNEAICSTGFCVLRSNNVVLPEWLFYCAISDDLLSQVTPKMRGANYPAVTDKDILSSKIPVPSLEEQSRIINRIKECLSRIDEINQLREENRQDAEAIESATFADFLEEAANNGSPVVTLGAVLLKSQYGISAKASVNSKGVPILRMGNIQNGHLDFSDLKHIELSRDELRKYRLELGDILINRTNSMELVGKSAMFEEPEGDWVFASYLVRLVIDRSKALPEFVNAAINSRIGRAYVYATARRAIGMVNINAKEIAKMPLPLPSIKKQEQIVTRLRDARTAAKSLLEDLSIEPIKALPGAVLRKAFAGEL